MVKGTCTEFYPQVPDSIQVKEVHAHVDLKYNVLFFSQGDVKSDIIDHDLGDDWMKSYNIYLACVAGQQLIDPYVVMSILFSLYVII